MSGKKWVGRSGYYFIFYLYFVSTQMHIFGCDYASLAQILNPKGNRKLKLLIAF